MIGPTPLPLLDVSTSAAVAPPSLWVDLAGPTHYVDFGGPADGPLVVCVHGLGGSHVNWLAVGPLLADRCRVLALDLAGHGRTPTAGRRTDVRSNRSLLDRFLARVTHAPAVVVGNSMGGMITLLQAAAVRRSVAGMVLVDPALPPPRGTRPDPRVALSFASYAVPWLGERVLAGRRRRFTAEQLVLETLTLCCVDVDRVPRHVVDASVRLVHERASQPDIDKAFLAAARSLMAILARPGRYVDLIRTVPQPALLLQGARDRLVPLAAAREAALLRPDWTFEVREDIGHVPQLEDPEWTAETILDWLAADGASAADAARGGAVRVG